MLRFGFIFVLLVFFQEIGFTQKVDSVAWARNRTQYYYDKTNPFEMPITSKIDTVIKGLEQYNQSFNRNKFSEWAGNIGRPSKRIIFDPRHTVGFDIGIHSFDDLLFNNYSQPYYQVRRPYTSINYISGPEKKKFFK